jgi:hypothetical protein
MHMEAVQVLFPVPEVCNRGCGLLCYECLLVAEHTEVIPSILIGGIKVVGKGKPQDKGIIRSMGIVAGRAVALNNRPMLKTAVLPLPALFVAAETDFICPVAHKGCPVRIVR